MGKPHIYADSTLSVFGVASSKKGKCECLKNCSFYGIVASGAYCSGFYSSVENELTEHNVHTTIIR